MNKNLIIKAGLFYIDVMVSIGESNEELESKLSKFIEHNDLKQIYDNYEARTFRFSEGQILIRLHNYLPDSTMSLAVLQHEIFHAACLILEYVGINFDLEKNDEVYAYLIQDLTYKIHLFLRNNI